MKYLQDIEDEMVEHPIRGTIVFLISFFFFFPIFLFLILFGLLFLLVSL